MQRLLLSIPLLLAGLSPAYPDTSPRDSLRNALANTAEPAQQIPLYRDLADVTVETPECRGYLAKLYTPTKASGDTPRMMEAPTDLVSTYILLDKIDSARYYEALARQVSPEKEHDRGCCHLSMRLFDAELLGNADKFTDRGSITLHCVCKDRQVEISVTDTGCGIPLKMQQVVFDRFTKLNTYKPGSGLGLYLCKLIVRRLSGRIFIDPKYTGSTRIMIILPIE